MEQGWDDHLVAHYVTRCLESMKDCPMTITKMTVCYNLTERVLRLFCVQGEKKDVVKLIDEFHSGLIDSIQEYYD